MCRLRTGHAAQTKKLLKKLKRFESRRTRVREFRYAVHEAESCAELAGARAEVAESRATRTASIADALKAKLEKQSQAKTSLVRQLNRARIFFDKIENSSI